MNGYKKLSLAALTPALTALLSTLINAADGDSDPVKIVLIVVSGLVTGAVSVTYLWCQHQEDMVSLQKAPAPVADSAALLAELTKLLEKNP